MQLFKGLKLKTILPIVLFAALMTWLIWYVMAVGPFVSIETESASLSGNVQAKTDSSASAGSYLSFGTTSGGGSSPWDDAGVKAFSCSGVTINPGDNWQNKINANPAGTTFCIKSGIHRMQQIAPKTNNNFIGEIGAVMSGEDVTEYAVGGTGGDGVTIKGLIIEKYVTPIQQGVIRATNMSYDWILENNEIRYNGGTAIRSSAGWQIRNNYVHHQGQLGVLGIGAGIVLEANEIAFNNTDNVDSHWEAGGTKFLHTTNLVMRNNYVHDNKGPGLWADANNIYVLYEGNLVLNNRGPGIDHEISHDAIIRNNVVEGNGFGWTAWLDGAGILVNTSANVEVYGNTVRYNNDGIAGIHATRSSSSSTHGIYELKNLWVHDNIVAMNVGHSGVVTNTSDPVFSSGWNNRYDRNNYKLGPNAKYYKWQGVDKNTAEWKAAGQDINSTWQ